MGLFPDVGISVLFFLLGMLALAWPASAQDVLQAAEMALERWDGDEAYRLAQTVLADRPTDPQALALLTKGAFYRGEYLEAAQWAARWEEIEPTNEQAKGWKGFAAQTAAAVQDLKMYTSPHFNLRLHEGRDGVLAEYALAAL